jgi:hypothetical protein
MKKKRKRESIERETKLLADRESLRLREFHEQTAFAHQKLIDRCTCEIGEERGLQP